MLERMLRFGGYTTDVAADGETAVEFAASHEPTVALVDLRLGGTHGMEVMARIKEASPRTECIIYTGNATKKSAIESVNGGAFGYLEKPADMDRLMRMVHEAEERAGATAQAVMQGRTTEAINRVLTAALHCSSQEELARACLQVAEELTRSRFGFIGELNAAGLMDVTAISDPGWAECRMPGAEARRLLQNMEPRGLFGRVLQTKEPLLTNRPGEHPEAVGIPVGHPVLDCFLGVPLRRQGETVGIIALANKPRGYDQNDEEALVSLSVAVREALDRREMEDRVRISHRFLEIACQQADLEPLLGAYLAEVEQVSGSAACTIRLLDEAGQLGLELHGSCGGVPPELTGRCPWQAVAREETDPRLPHFTSGGAFITNNLSSIAEDPASVADSDHPGLDHETAAVIPIRVDDRVLGLIFLAEARGKVFHRTMVQHLEPAARLMASAMERAMDRQALRKSEESYRALVEASPDGIILASLQGSVIRANPQAAAMFGVDSPEEMIGKGIPEFMAPGDRQGALDAMRRVLELGSAQGTERTLLREDRSTFQAEVSAAVHRGEDGRPEGFVVVFRDVSERARMQAMLVQSDRMASMGSLAAGVAHEINNPLTFLMYNLDSLKLELPTVTRALSRTSEHLKASTQLDAARLIRDFPVMRDRVLLDDLVEQVEEAREGARRVHAIVRDIKTFSRADEEETRPVELDRVIHSAVSMARHEIKYRARVVVQLGGPPTVMGNDGRMCQVFLNLLVNAAQAIEDGSVGDNEISVRTWSQDRRALAEVRDTGCGIPSEHLARLFDPFFTTKAPGEGTGLGLSICHNIIADMGGIIEVDSAPGQGTCFTLSFPAHDAAPFAARPGSDSDSLHAETGGRRLLVVDDERMIHKALGRVFSGYEMVCTTSGNEAQELLQRDARFHAVLCDLMMADGSGMDLYRWLEERQPHLARRTLIISGGGVTPRAREFLNKLGDRALPKPLDVPRLISMVERMGEGGS